MNDSNTYMLFQLLRIALCKEHSNMLSNYDNVDWTGIYQLSMKQNVGAIACDGMCALENCNIDDELRYKWMGQSIVLENKSFAQWNLACQLSQLFAKNGIKTFVLKGISYASYYPIPRHRVSSDLDICLLDGFERGNLIVERNGIHVDREDSKHAHFLIGNIHVENHQFCIGVRGNKRNKRIEKYLRQLLKDGGDYIGTTNINRPIWLFNALFFVCHAETHLLIESGLTLKHVCDWKMLKARAVSREVVDTFWKDCERFGLSKIAKAIDEVVENVFDDKGMSKEAQYLLNDILTRERHPSTSTSKLSSHLGMMKTMWMNRKKFKYFSETTSIKMIVIYIFGYLFDRNPKV